LTGESDVFTTSETLRRTAEDPSLFELVTELRSLAPRGFSASAGEGVFFPRSPRSIEPLTSLSPLLRSARDEPAFAGILEREEPPRPP